MARGEVDMSNKRYPEEFKIEAVKQVVDRGHSVADVASRFVVIAASASGQNYCGRKNYRDRGRAEYASAIPNQNQTTMHNFARITKTSCGQPIVW